MLCESRATRHARCILPLTVVTLAAALMCLIAGPLLAADPVNQSVSPNSGTLPVARTMFLYVTHSDAAGWSNISGSYVIVNSAVSGTNGIYLFYDANLNQLFLRNETNTGWLGGVSPGAASVLENSRCKVYCAQTWLSPQNQTLTVQWCVELKSPMAGRAVNAYVYSTNKTAGKDGWDQLGSYTVGAVPVQPPANTSLAPNAGSIQVNTPSTFTAVYSDPDGAGNLAGCYLLANTAFGAANAVYVWYDVASNKLWARDDANTSWLGGFAPGSASGFPPGPPNTIETNLFKLHCAQTTVSTSGNNVTINWRIELKPVVMGASVKAWMYVIDRTGRTAGWDQKASWTIVSDNDPPDPPGLGIPMRVPVGPRVAFETRFSDPDGAGDIKGGYILINTSLSGANAIYIWADAAEGKIWLRNDANTAWIGGYEAGSSNTVENARCKVFLADTDVYQDFNGVTIYLSLQLKDPMAEKSFTAWMYAVDWEGANTGWVKKSSFYAYRPQPPVNVSIAPSGGDLLSGPRVELKTTQTDQGGAQNIKGSYLLVDETLDGANACYLWFDAENWKLKLRNDQNTAWLPGFAPGSPNVMENSTVRVYCEDTYVKPESKTLTVFWSIEFKTPVAPRNVSAWLYATNWYNKFDGWDQMGSFTIRQIDPSTAQGRLQSLIEMDGELIDPCAEFAWFDDYKTAQPNDKTALLGWSIARVACTVKQIESKYAVAQPLMQKLASFQNAVQFASGGDLAGLARMPVSFVTGHGAEALVSSSAPSDSSGFTMKPASSDELTPGALAGDIRNEMIPALQDAIAALAPVIADTSFVASFTIFEGKVGHIRTEEVRMYRAALEAVLAMLSTAVAYSWDDTGFDWTLAPQDRDLNQDGYLTPAEYLPGGTFGTLVDQPSLTTAWNALNAALDDAMAVAESDFAVNDPDQFLQMVKPLDRGALLAALDQAEVVLAGRVVVPYQYYAGPDPFNQQEIETYVTVDLRRFWLNPITSLRALAPTLALRRSYYGDPFVQVYSVPDPSMNGIFPRGAWQIPLSLWNEWFGDDPTF